MPLSVNVSGVQTLVLQPINEQPTLPAFITLLDPLLIKAKN
jgi:hypothetical protein